jgi:hypothetical protein
MSPASRFRPKAIALEALTFLQLGQGFTACKPIPYTKNSLCPSVRTCDAVATFQGRGRGSAGQDAATRHHLHPRVMAAHAYLAADCRP